MTYRILKALVFSILLAVSSQNMAQQVRPVVSKIPDSFCISLQENKLYRMINEYRRRYSLPPIPLSRSLCFVASIHARDLFVNPPEEPCNLHSWSAHGAWKPFCYPRDEEPKNSVWDKPKEISGYPGKGYEIVYWGTDLLNIDSVMSEWKGISYFNSFLTNTGKWQGRKWEAIGIALFENYAVAWFGDTHDPGGEPWVCGQRPVMEKNIPAAKEPSVQPVSRSEASSGIYYLIVKGWISEAEAQRQLPIVRENGFPGAKILSHDNKIRISVYETTSKADADSNLRIIRKKYKDAWILKN